MHRKVRKIKKTEGVHKMNSVKSQFVTTKKTEEVYFINDDHFARVKDYLKLVRLFE